MTVEITLEIAPCANPTSASPSFHERSLEDVPQPTVRQMLQDFAAYKAKQDGAEQHKLYRYHRPTENGTPAEEAVIAIDFGEVVLLQVLGPKTTGHEVDRRCAPAEQNGRMR